MTPATTKAKSKTPAARRVFNQALSFKISIANIFSVAKRSTIASLPRQLANTV